jgi:hypothetical protein
VVADAGDLAHVYFTETEEPLPLEALEARHGAQLRAVLTCPGSGIVVVRGGKAGFAYQGGRWRDLSEPSSLDDVLGYDRELLRRYLAEMAAMPSAGDLVVFGAGATGGDVAYAWEFGSHGGVGNGDVDIFFIRPWNVDVGDLAGKGPADLHRFFSERFVPARADGEVASRE